MKVKVLLALPVLIDTDKFTGDASDVANDMNAALASALASDTTLDPALMVGDFAPAAAWTEAA